MKEVVQTFEDIIRRTLAPATAFLFLLGVVHLADAAFRSDITAGARWDAWVAEFVKLGETKSVLWLGAGLLIGLTGCSYVLALIHQAIFDNGLRGSFSSGWGKDHLAHPRKKVRERMFQNPSPELLQRIGKALEDAAGGNPENTATTTDWKDLDYMLYEVVGGIDQGSTTSFVNDAKAYGVISISAALAVFSLGLRHPADCGYWLFIVPAMIGCFFLGRWLVKSQYRARALRLYVNLLMMPDSKIIAILRDYQWKNSAEAATTPVADTSPAGMTPATPCGAPTSGASAVPATAVAGTNAGEQPGESS